MIWGIDISHWQGIVDWAQVNANPDIGFVIMKATEGTTFVDSRFAANWAACRKPKAPYAFWRYAADAVAQAKHFHDIVAQVAGSAKMRPVIDLEDSASPKMGNIYSNLIQFEDSVRAKFDSRVPLVYTAAWWWDPWVGRDTLRVNPLWVAHYPKWWKDASDNWRVAVSFAEMLDYLAAHPTAGPILPKTGGWGNWFMWQFTSSGKIPGIAGNVDLNLFNGTQDDLNAFFYSDAPPPPNTNPLESRVAALEGLTAEQGARLLAVEAKLAAVKEAL